MAAMPALARDPAPAAATIVETRLRAGPSRRGHPLLRLPEGTSVTIHGKPEQGWYRVRHGRLEGYLPTGDVATSPRAGTQSSDAPDAPRDVAQAQRAGKRDRASREERKQARKQQRKQERRRNHGVSPPTGRSTITSTSLNLRERPDQASPVMATMPRGAKVEPTGNQQDGWVELMWEGQAGWALGRHLAAPKPVVFTRGGDSSSWSRAELKRIIYDAADRYGQPREDMLRVARCESNLVPSAVNQHGGSYGLFQFKPGTWLSTPYADYDIFDPRASANAAAWMWSVGRRREWVCQ
jgi:uncharacterized protein YgiM (DUF1202 family)